MLGRYLVCGQQHQHQLDWLGSGGAADRRELLELVDERQSVAALGLGRRGAASIRASRGRIAAASSSAEAPRVERTVERMPPPASAIS